MKFIWAEKRRKTALPPPKNTNNSLTAHRANKAKTMEHGENFEDTILLKIKRDFTESEAVKQLLKMLSELEIEVGMLKSEKSEMQDRINKMTNEGLKGRKLWLQEDVVKDLDHQLKRSKETQKMLQKQTNEWREKYFSLMAKNNHSYPLASPLIQPNNKPNQ